MELKEKVSRNSDGLQIQATVALLQESKPGKMDPKENGNPPGMEDIFMGGGPSRGAIGTVTTEAFSDSSKQNTFYPQAGVNQSLRDKFRRMRGATVKE